MMALQPISFQSELMKISGRKAEGVVSTDCRPNPQSSRIWLMTPSLEKRLKNKPETMIHEIKWGKV